MFYLEGITYHCNNCTNAEYTPDGKNITKSSILCDKHKDMTFFERELLAALKDINENLVSIDNQLRNR